MQLPIQRRYIRALYDNILIIVKDFVDYYIIKYVVSCFVS